MEIIHLTNVFLVNYCTPTSLKATIDSQDCCTWFPADEKPAFYIPKDDASSTTLGEEKYSVLTYKNIQRLISSMAPFSSYSQELQDNESSALVVVAVFLPACLMTDTALAILAIMTSVNSVAAPLEPDMTPSEVSSALDQLNCQAIVTTKELWVKISPIFEEVSNQSAYILCA